VSSPAVGTSQVLPTRRQPPLRLRRLGSVLARLRTDAGLSLADVVEATSIDRTTLYRIETGQARPQRRTLLALLDRYAVAANEPDGLFELARRAAEQSWVQSFSGALPESYRAYIEFEGDAEQILNYESLYTPGRIS
jgi:transcriptional regulator with XRE-family HTH domain